jgi:hypothetical protein
MKAALMIAGFAGLVAAWCDGSLGWGAAAALFGCSVFWTLADRTKQ